MKKNFFNTLVLLFFTLTIMGQSNKITQITTTHVHGTDFEGVQSLPTTFDIYVDSVVMTFIDPEMVVYLEALGQPTQSKVEGRVQLLEENEYGRVYFFRDIDGEIILRDYKTPSVKLTLLQHNGLNTETNFITFEKKGRL